MFKNMGENIPGGSFPDTTFLLLQRKLNSR